MNPEQSNNPDARLQQTLRAWQVGESLPPGFADRVWRRVAQAETQAGASPWIAWFSWLNQVLSRPAAAAGYVAVLILAGLLAGYWHAQVENQHALRQLETRYVQMLDPYQMPRH